MAIAQLNANTTRIKVYNIPISKMFKYLKNRIELFENCNEISFLINY